MPRPVDLPAIKTRSTNALNGGLARYDAAVAAGFHYRLLRWIAKMTAVELHTVWERYVESRLVAALNHNPQHFLTENSVRGVRRVSCGLAFYVVRTGGRYFDFRSMSDLIDKADRMVGRALNPFRAVTVDDKNYIDTLSAVRNVVVHGSEAAVTSYKRSLRSTYGIRAAPEPDEFLNARDLRAGSPARYRSRLHGLATFVARAIRDT